MQRCINYPYVKKRISHANLAKRITYSQAHLNKTIQRFWQYKIFTDEAHVDPSEMRAGEILHEEGTRYDSENILELGGKAGVKLHVAAWVSLYAKCNKLIFYHDEEEHIERPKKPTKPRT